MKGGLKAWRDAGYEVFTGVNVPCKAFGEVVEHDNDTPRIDAADLQKLLDAKTDLVILDSRPMPRVQQHVDPRRHRLPGRRAGLSREGLRAATPRRWWW